MMKLTTYPYWLRFHSAQPYDFASQDKSHEIPKLILLDRRETIPRLRNLLPTIAKICPVCLTQDFEKYGEPYLHRAHHLPFVRICHTHRTELISKCPKCSRIFRLDSTFVYARLTCTCDYDLRQIRTEKTLREVPWEKLACYSADVLFSEEPISECTRFYNFFDSLLAQHGVSQGPDLLKYLSEIYGGEEAKAILTLGPQRSDTYKHSLIGSLSKRDFRAPQICAFLAAIDLNFTRSQDRFTAFVKTYRTEPDHELKMSEISVRPRLPQSVTQARCWVAETEKTIGKNSTRSFLYRRYKTLFWYLTLFDQAWFDGNYPPYRGGATEHLPSIESDRFSLLQAISKAPKNTVRLWKNLAQQAFFRASLRDAEWLEARKKETAHEVKERRLASQRQYLDCCLNDLTQAVEQIQTIKGRNVRVHQTELAPYTSLNEDQLRHLLTNHPDLKERLMRPAVDWAIEK